MTAGGAIGSRAIGDGGRRDLATEWGGPDPSAAPAHERAFRRGRELRRMMVRKP